MLRRGNDDDERSLQGLLSEHVGKKTSKKTGKTGQSSLGISDLTWVKNERREERKNLTGAYVIETTHTGLSASDIWSLYTVLTQVEGAFRALKSDLGVRPVFHQKTDRTRAHLFVSVLAYYLLSDIESRLRAQGDSRSWSLIRGTFFPPMPG